MMSAATLLLTACNNEASTTTDGKNDSTSTAVNDEESKEERNKKVVMASMEGVNSHDPDKVFKDAADGVSDHNDGSWPVTKGKDSVIAGFKTWLSAFPDVKGDNLKYVADGDWVMVWGDWSGTWKGDFMGQKATGKSWKAKDVDIFKLDENGKILEHHNVQSPITTASQVGMKMPN